MKILSRYLARTVLSSIALVSFLLAGLQLFLLFVNQLDDLGKGYYALPQAFLYVLLQLPAQIYLFFPMACLLGCLAGLGMMANHRELVVMRAAGMSIGQISFVVSKVSLLLILIVSFCGESIIPWASRYANDTRILALAKGDNLRTSRGLWLRHDQDFVHIGRVQSDTELLSVLQFHFDAKHRLLFSRSIKNIKMIDGKWLAFGVEQTLFHAKKTQIQQLPRIEWDLPISTKLLQASIVEPEEMTIPELYHYIRAQKKNHQNAHLYQLAFWQRLIQPLNAWVMLLLAIPFIFGPLRSSTMGARFVAGAAAGFGFHLIHRFFAPLSLVFQLSPLFAAIGPTLLFALLGLYLMRRTQ